MNSLIVLDQIPFQVDLPALQEKQRLHPGSARANELAQLAVQAQAIARPKAVYKLSFIEGKGSECVNLDGIEFTSRVLRVNLDGAHRVFPYVASCGMELEAWQNGFEDLLQRFWVDAIKEQALWTAYQAFEQHLMETYQPGQLSAMHPGSLEDWPLTQQQPLFKLLGNVEEAIGVKLTESCLMLPNKTVSGILFPTETSFASCQLCPRQVCSGRRAPYDPTLYAQKYQSHTQE